MCQRNLKKPCLNRLPVCPFFRWRCKWRPSVVLYGNLKLAHDGFSTGLWSWKVGSSDFCWDAWDYNIEGYKSIQVLQVISNLLGHSWLQHKLDQNQTKHVVELYRSANVLFQQNFADVLNELTAHKCSYCILAGWNGKSKTMNGNGHPWANRSITRSNQSYQALAWCNDINAGVVSTTHNPSWMIKQMFTIQARPKFGERSGIYHI